MLLLQNSLFGSTLPVQDSFIDVSQNHNLVTQSLLTVLKHTNPRDEQKGGYKSNKNLYISKNPGIIQSMTHHRLRLHYVSVVAFLEIEHSRRNENCDMPAGFISVSFAIKPNVKDFISDLIKCIHFTNTCH